MIHEHYIKASDRQSVIVSQEDDGMALSVHIAGGHIMVMLDKKESRQLLEGIQDIMSRLEEE